MGDGQAWVPLTGTGDDVVLAVDFGGAREEAGFGELAPLLPAGITVLASQSPAGLPDGVAGAAARLDRWRDEAAGRQVTAVLGYCAGAAVASWLAGEIGGDTPAVVLLDPATTTAGTLLASYHTSTASLVEALGRPAEPDEEAAELAAAAEPTAAGLLDLAARLAARYERTAEEAGRELDLSDELVGDLVARFTRYLGYLVITRQAEDRRQATPPSLSLVSAVHPADAFPAPGELRRFEVPRSALLAEPEVAQAVAEFTGLPTRVPGTPRR